MTALPVQLGGAAGTLAALHPHGPAVAASLARRLGLADAAPWHAERTRIGELAGALAVAAGACAKPATDIVLLAGTELGEVCEGAPGDSSSMPHKRNPIAAITARAAARRAPGPRRCCSAPPTTSTSARRERGTPSGRPWPTCCVAPEAPPPGCGPPSTGCGCTPTGWLRTSPSAWNPSTRRARGELVDRLLRERTLTG